MDQNTHQQFNRVIGRTTGEPIYGMHNDSTSAVFNPATAEVVNTDLYSSTFDTYGTNLDWLITRHCVIFDCYIYGSTHLILNDENINA